MTQARNWILDHRYSSFMGAGALALVALPVIARLAPTIAIEGPAILFFVTYLLLAWSRLKRLTPAFLRQHAETADAPAFVILFVTALAIAAAVGSLFAVLNREIRGASLELLTAAGSVIFGWLTIHTMAAMHYAHVYWKPGPTQQGGHRPHRGGLDFPGTPEPCGHDFVYFALVIGMTAQTADVSITTTAMRRLNMIHATTSYFFNTVLIAAAVNAAVALAG
ncbi:DUF1345 domain-containing protein [Rhizobium sp. SL42]|uniref:DUF1345 domain-containing protein n=1 Tax=Rhizobium sp. SL42 TaxID=2806346 RepID=UPI003FA78A62|nr:DUF1345 domain-containing protein [Rhizobium sp. SL42]